MKILERLGVDEYYQTLSTWMKIIDEKNKAISGDSGSMSSDSGGEDDKKVRRRMSSKK